MKNPVLFQGRLSNWSLGMNEAADCFSVEANERLKDA